MAGRNIRAAETLQFSSFYMDEALANKEVGSFSYPSNSPDAPHWRMKLWASDPPTRSQRDRRDIYRRHAAWRTCGV